MLNAVKHLYRSSKSDDWITPMVEMLHCVQHDLPLTPYPATFFPSYPTTGRRSVAVVPCPGSETSVSVPPCRCAIFCVTASPIP